MSTVDRIPTGPARDVIRAGLRMLESQENEIRAP